jgi:hypothetical protein
VTLRRNRNALLCPTKKPCGPEAGRATLLHLQDRKAKK